MYGRNGNFYHDTRKKWFDSIGKKKKQKFKIAFDIVILSNCNFVSRCIFLRGNLVLNFFSPERLSNCFSIFPIKYTEIQVANGKRDRAKQEIFLHENSVALSKVPLEELNQNWLNNYRSSLKRDARARPESISIEIFLQNNTSTLKFLESTI